MLNRPNRIWDNTIFSHLERIGGLGFSYINARRCFLCAHSSCVATQQPQGRSSCAGRNLICGSPRQMTRFFSHSPVCQWDIHHLVFFTPVFTGQSLYQCNCSFFFFFLSPKTPIRHIFFHYKAALGLWYQRKGTASWTSADRKGTDLYLMRKQTNKQKHKVLRKLFNLYLCPMQNNGRTSPCTPYVT